MKGGCKNILGFLDKWTIEYDKSLNKSSNSFNANVNLPFFYKNGSLDICYNTNRKPLYENYKADTHEIQENYSMQYNKDRHSISANSTHRMNHGLHDSSEVVPSTKYSIIYNQSIKSDITKLYNRYVGSFSQALAEATLPFSQVNYVRLSYQGRWY